MEDDSNFVKSWSISSFILGRRNKSKRRRIIRKIKPLEKHGSVAIRSRASKALKILENENEPIPDTWKKTGKNQ